MSNKTVLEYVQTCLSTMDSDNVDDINDTTESLQVAQQLQDTYYELLNRQRWEFLKGPATLTAAVDVTDPTRFAVPETLRELHELWYNVAETGVERRQLKYLEPDDFLTRFSGAPGTGKLLVEYGALLQFYVRTDKQPHFYTTFDDETIHCDSYDSSVESTLQSHKVSARGVSIPTFQVTNTFVPDLPDHMVPLLQASLNSACHLYFKQQASAVDSARERRQLAQARTRNNVVASRNTYYANSFGRR